MSAFGLRMGMRRPIARVEIFLLVAAALALPTLSLIPLGGIWLWQEGWLLTWAIAACALVVAAYVLQWWLLRPVQTAEPPALSPTDKGPSHWNDRERAAWADVQALSRGVRLEDVSDLDAALELARSTVDTVARRMNDNAADAVWRFTLPEALAITERVSRRLATVTVNRVPFGSRLTVAQFLSLYRARRIVDLAGKAYDFWRLLRMVNPATAVTHEARERLARAMLDWGREQVARRLTTAFVEEVGRAAIDLYGGRLRIVNPDLSSPLQNGIENGDGGPKPSGGEKPRR